MATNWIALTGQDLAEVLTWDAITKANQNLGESGANASESGAAVDLAEANRRDALIANIIAEVRSAIQSAGRIPLSVTPGCVPPGARRHVLNLAAWQLINSTPSLYTAILSGAGIGSGSALLTPFASFYGEAIKYVESLRNGEPVPQPTDPTGMDYLTAVSDTNLAIRGVQWSDLYGDDVDYENGYKTTSDGQIVDLPLDDMTT